MNAINEHLFLLLNAGDHPARATVAAATVIATDVIFTVALLLAVLWSWGGPNRRAGLLATAIATTVALGLNQVLGFIWYEPRPFMIGLGHTLAEHAPENSFPSDHATFMFTVGLGLVATGAARAWGLVVCAAGMLVAWARVYLGLHFPIDMVASVVLAGLCALGATAAEWLVVLLVLPTANRWYDVALDWLHLPRSMFPRAPAAE